MDLMFCANHDDTETLFIPDMRLKIALINLFL